MAGGIGIQLPCKCAMNKIIDTRIYDKIKLRWLFINYRLLVLHPSLQYDLTCGIT